MNPTVKRAWRTALGVPVVLLLGAFVSEHVFGLFPCEMCWWQRWAHFAALALGIAVMFVPAKRLFIALAALAILVSGAIGAYHAGVEYGWWEGFTTCSAAASGGGSALDAILDAPLVRCDEVQWSLWGISLAGFNFLISSAAALWIFVLLGRRA